MISLKWKWLEDNYYVCQDAQEPYVGYRANYLMCGWESLRRSKKPRKTDQVCYPSSLTYYVMLNLLKGIKSYTPFHYLNE